MTDRVVGNAERSHPGAGEVVIGDVVEFDEARGLGAVEYGDGRRLPFHCTAITDGSRRITLGTVVAFEVVAGRLGRLEARSIRPLPGVMPGATLGQVVREAWEGGAGGVPTACRSGAGADVTSLGRGPGASARLGGCAGRPRRCHAPVGNTQWVDTVSPCGAPVELLGVRPPAQTTPSPSPPGSRGRRMAYAGHSASPSRPRAAVGRLPGRVHRSLSSS